MKLLLIVDLQYDFCPGGNLAVAEGDRITPIVNKLIRDGGFDLIVATRDWHPADHISFAKNHEGAELFSAVDTPYGKQMLWPEHCVQDTHGADLRIELNTARIDKIISKGMDPDVDSYSAFFDNAHGHQTDLLLYLQEYCQENSINLGEVEIAVCGLALDYCVKATAIDAAELGFKTSIILDATRSVHPENDIELCRDLIAQHGIEIVESRSLNVEKVVELKPQSRSLEI